MEAAAHRILYSINEALIALFTMLLPHADLMLCHLLRR